MLLCNNLYSKSPILASEPALDGRDAVPGRSTHHVGGDATHHLQRISPAPHRVELHELVRSSRQDSGMN